MLVLPKMPSSLTPLCSAESRPFDRPVTLANICAIIWRALTPFISSAPRSRCRGKIQSSGRKPKQQPTMIASWPIPVYTPLRTLPWRTPRLRRSSNARMNFNQ